MLLLLITLFLLGLLIGSFLLVVADRTGAGTSFISGRSKCSSCQHPLSWYELFPVVSYLVLKGRCRYCHTVLSLWYPLSEITAGIVTVLVFVATFGMGFGVLLPSLIIAYCLLVVCFADIKYEIIPLSSVILATISTVFLLFQQSPVPLLPHLYASLGAGSFFLCIYALTKGRGMGFGDVIFSFFMGLLLGFPSVLIGLYIAFIVGSVVSLLLVVLRRKKLHGGTIPFGPFLAVATFLMMVWGDAFYQAIAYYVK